MGNKTSTIDKTSIQEHHETTAKSRMKILLFGSNIGKSHWFNGTTEHKTIFNITFKIKSFNIGNKLPEIKTVIYDTPRNLIFFNDTIKYLSYSNMPSTDGLIFTYNIHCMDSLYHLEECMDKIKQTIRKRVPCLLLGIQETNDTNVTTNYVDQAQTFAIKHNLYHLEINIASNINSEVPYIYLLRKILKQKQTILSRFDNEKYIEKNNQEIQDNDDYKNDFLMPYALRQFANEEHYNSDPMEDEDEKNVQNIETLGIELELETETNPTNQTVCTNLRMDYENDVKTNEFENELYDYCQLEFERFFKVTMGVKRCDKYLHKFKQKQYNDIRLIDPEILDHDWFKMNEIKMDLLDQKLFKKEIKKYKNDCIKFENMLRDLNMSEKYHKQFCDRGIATLWSFYYYVHSIEDIEGIICNKMDAIIIWSKFSAINNENNHNNNINYERNSNHHVQIEGINKSKSTPNNAITPCQFEWIAKNANVGNSSDSEAIYNDPN